MELRLKIEMLPGSLWGKSLRQVAPRPWEEIRRRAYAEAGYRCSICGADARLNAHEQWTFDVRAKRARLSGITAICRNCHHVTHYGKAQLLADQGKLDLERDVVEHFMHVNGCDRAAFRAHARDAQRTWAKLNRVAWKVDYGAYVQFVERSSTSDASLVEPATSAHARPFVREPSQPSHNTRVGARRTKTPKRTSNARRP